MFKRLLWLMIGAGFGLGASFWMARVLRDTVARYSPERVSSDLATAARGVGAELRAALAEGRQAMRDREAELRARVSPGREP